MSSVSLSEVQYLNLVALTILHDAILRDPVAACATFGLRRNDLETIQPLLAPERILSAVANAGHESLVSLREGAATLLTRPAPLLGALAAVRPQLPSAPLGARATPAPQRV